MNYRLLSIDPSLAEPGYTVFDLGRADPHLEAAGVFETKRAKEGRRKSVFDDNMRRVRFLYRELARVVDRWAPQIVVVEAAGGSKSANAVAALYMSQTLVACLVDERLNGGVPVYLTAPAIGDALGLAPTQRATKGAPKTGSQRNKDRKARKAAIAQAVVARIGPASWIRALGLEATSEDFEEGLAAVLDPRWEGAHDSAAAALAAWDRPEVAGLRAIARQMSIPGTEGAAA